MRSNRSNRVVALAFFGLTFGSLAATASFTGNGRADAAIFTWNISSGTAWSTPGDWLNAAVPGSTDTALFNTNGTYTNKPSTGGTAESVGAIYCTGTGAVTISGSSAGVLTLAGTTVNGNPFTGIEVDLGAGAVTVSAPVALGASQTWINNSSNNLTVSGVVSASSSTYGLTKSGAQTLILSGSNTYSGGTTLSAGILQVSNSSSLGSGPLSFNGSATLQAGAASVSVPNNIALGSGNAATFATNGDILTVTGSVGNTGTNVIPLLVGGNGTLVLAGPLSLSGIPNNAGTPAIMMNTGSQPLQTLTITGTGTISGISIGFSNSRKTLNLQPSGTLILTNTVDSLDVGQDNTSSGPVTAGVVSQSSGTVDALGTISLGMSNNAAYGSYSLSGSTSLLIAAHLYNGGNATGAGNSLFLQTSGTANIGSTILGCPNDTSNSGSNTMHISGGVYNNTAGNLVLGDAAGVLGVATVSGGGILNVSGNIAVSNNATATGILNLNGGTTTANAVTSAGGTGVVNFNGGMLVAGSNAATNFLSGLSSSVIYQSGGTINTNGQNITIAQPLLGAATVSGSGVSSITLATSGNYTGAPVVTISGGGGSGATAEATINGSGLINGITITCPGTGYISAPTVTFLSSGTVATVGSVTLAANATDGGLTKTGSGTLTLGGHNTYVGPTLVNNGALSVTGSLGNTTVTVAGGAALSGGGNAGAGNGIIGGSAIVNGGGAMSLVLGDSTTSLTVNSGLTLGGSGAYGAGNYATLNYTVGSNGIEMVNLGSSTLTLNSGGAYVDVVPIVTPATATTYTVMTFSATSGTGQFSLSPTTPNVTSGTVGRDALSLIETGGSLQVTVSGPATPGVAYFYGGAPTTAWNDLTSPTSSNWSLDVTGTQDAENFPGQTTDVIFSAGNLSGSAVMSILGTNTTINSLNVSSSAATTINADGSTLTINALGDSNTDATGAYTGNPAGAGISIDAGAGPVTINVPVLLGGNQTWTNGSGNTLTLTGSIQGTTAAGNTQMLNLVNSSSGGTTISGAIGDGTSGGSLAVVVNNSGPGITTLAGANTYTGGTTLTNGTLALGNVAALSSGPVAVNGGQLDLAGFSPTITALNGIGGTISNNLNVTAATLTVNSGNYSGSINNGLATIALVKAGSGTLTLSGSNAYGGSTTISAGTLAIGGAGVLGLGGTYNGNIAIAAVGSLLNYNSTAAQTLSGNISGNGGLAQGGGLLTLAGSDSYGNGATVTGGTLTVSPAGTVTDYSTNGLLITGLNAEVNILGSYTKVGTNSFLKIEGGGVLNVYGAVSWFGNGGVRVGAGSSPGTLDIYSGSMTLSTTVSSDAFNLGYNNSGVVNVSGGTLTVTNADGLNVGGSSTNGAGVLNIGGSGVVVMSGSGGFNLAANSTTSGTINLNAGGVLQTSKPINGGAGMGVFNFNGGTLVAAASSSNFLKLSGSADFAYVLGGGALINTNGYNITIGQSLLGTPGDGGLTLNDTTGTGSLVLSGSNTYNGNTTIAGGTLAIGGGGSLGLGSYSGNIAIAANSLFNYNSTAAQTLSGAISGNGGLTQSGNSTLTLTGSNIYGGNTTISAGTLAIGGDGSLGLGGAYNGNIAIAAAGTLFNYNSTAAQTLSGAISGNGGLTQNGGLLTLAASNSYSGTTLVSGGTLVLGDMNALSLSTFDTSGSGTLSFGTLFSATFGDLQGMGTLELTGSGGLAPVYLAVGNNNNSTTFSGALNDAGLGGSLTKIGTGTLTLTGSNTYVGGTTIASGVLQLRNSAALGAGGLAANGGTLDLAGYGFVVPSFSGTAGTVFSSSVGGLATLTVSQTNTTTFSGSIVNGAGQVGLALTGGTLVLKGVNGYSGPTTVSGGVLLAAALNTLSPSSAVTVNPGTLDVTTAAQQIGSLAIGSSGALNLSIGNLLSSSGTASFAAGSTLNISGTIATLPELLMTYSGSANGTFTHVSYDGGSLPGTDQLFYSTGGSLEIVSTGPPIWIAGSGNWSVGSNWSSGSQPNGAGMTAVFAQTSSGAPTVSLDVPVTLGSLQFASSTTSYALSGNTLAFNNSGGTSSVTVFSGTHGIGSALDITLGSLDIALFNNGILSLGSSGSISDDGLARSLTLDGDGTGQLVLGSANTNNWGGGTIVNAGTLIVDSATALPSGSRLIVGADASSLFSPAAAPLEAVAVSPVPEPGTLALAGTAVVALGLVCLRRRRARI